MERKLLGKHFRKFGHTSRGCPLFWKFWKMPFYSLLEIERKFKQDFLVEWKVPSIHGLSRREAHNFSVKPVMAWLLARSLPTQKYE